MPYSPTLFPSAQPSPVCCEIQNFRKHLNRITELGQSPALKYQLNLVLSPPRAALSKWPPNDFSSDKDPLLKFHRWQGNLRTLEIGEIKSAPYMPEFHPFIEHLFRSIRDESLDQTLFWNSYDLQIKLNKYKDFYNNTRGH